MHHVRRHPPVLKGFCLTLGVMLLCALCGALTTGPAEAYAPRANVMLRPAVPRALPRFVHAATTRLITGDRVDVLTSADGTSVARVLPGSPHAGAPVVRWRSGDATYVMPRTSGSERAKLDLSLFDVTALARFGARVPVVVRFAPHLAPHRVAGVRLEPATSRSTAAGMTVLGSYGRDFGGLTRRALAGVASIRLAVPQRPATAGQERTAPTHSLVVHVVDPQGQPAPGVIVTLLALDDASIVQDSTAADGLAHFDVPEGPYSVAGFDFSRLVLAPEVEVTADQTVELDLAQATVRPHVSMPGYRVVDTALSVGRGAEKGFSFPFEFTGPHFFMRVQPTSAVVAHGSLGTGVSATLVPQGSSGPARDRIAITADVEDGVPDDLTYVHHRGDFAEVVDQIYSNGPAGLRESFFGAFGYLPHVFLDMFSGRTFATQVPGRRVVLFQAGRRTSYQQTYLPQATSPTSSDVTQLTSAESYRRAGTTHLLRFAHGPVGPGIRGHVAPKTNYIRRVSGHFVANLPLFAGSGASLFSWVDSADGWWSLRRNGHRIAFGRHAIQLDAKVPSGSRHYALRAVSRPAARNWTLSTRVRDVWRFRSGGAHPAAPLLTPHYLPPISMNGHLRAGPTSFTLAFHSLTRHDHRVTHARFQLSTNGGRTWHDARLHRFSPTAFRVSYRNPPAHHAAHFMSLRITATDTRGDTVAETAHRVYRLS